jgi:hypothetical protein
VLGKWFKIALWLEGCFLREQSSISAIDWFWQVDRLARGGLGNSCWNVALSFTGTLTAPCGEVTNHWTTSSSRCACGCLCRTAVINRPSKVDSMSSQRKQSFEFFRTQDVSGNSLDFLASMFHWFNWHTWKFIWRNTPEGGLMRALTLIKVNESYIW